MGDPDDANDPETGDLAMFRCYHEGKCTAHAQSWVPDGGIIRFGKEILLNAGYNAFTDIVIYKAVRFE